MSYQLRPDQLQLRADIYNGWQSGARNMLAVQPTGGGKSVIWRKIVKDGTAQNLTECLIAHRNELVSQLSEHVADEGIPHRIIAPKEFVGLVVAKHRELYGRSFVNPDARVMVAGVDTLLARKDKLAPILRQVGRWGIDEAHHVQKHNKWGAAVALFPNAYGMGWTGSPIRADGGGLGSHHDGVFDMMVIGPNTRELINLGAICDYEYAEPVSDFEISEDDVTPSGDFSRDKMRKAVQRSHLVGDVVKEYMKLALGKRAICFATDVASAREIAANFNAVGIPAAAVDATTPTVTRDEYVRRFRNGTIKILVNVDLFGEGFDVPACEVVIMARPTASLSLYLQMCGRALRILAGKLYGLIIDHVYNRKRHGLPDIVRAWTLDRREKRARKLPDPDTLERIACMACSRPYDAFLRVCPWCGAEKPLPEPRLRSIKMVAGDLHLLTREMLEQMRAETTLEDPASIKQRVALAAGDVAAQSHYNKQIAKIQAQKRLQAAIEQWGGVQRWYGRPDHEGHRKFYLSTGMDILTALHKDRTREEYEKLAERVEGWCKEARAA